MTKNLRKLPRPYKHGDGAVFTKLTEICKCLPGDENGEKGGVCSCGGAIPTDEELRLLNDE